MRYTFLMPAIWLCRMFPADILNEFATRIEDLRLDDEDDSVRVSFHAATQIPGDMLKAIFGAATR